MSRAARWFPWVVWAFAVAALCVAGVALYQHEWSAAAQLVLDAAVMAGSGALVWVVSRG